MIQLYASYENGILQLQREPYIEDGRYIQYHDKDKFNSVDPYLGWKVYEIPQFGGEPTLIGEHSRFDIALILLEEQDT